MDGNIECTNCHAIFRKKGRCRNCYEGQCPICAHIVVPRIINNNPQSYFLSVIISLLIVVFILFSIVSMKKNNWDSLENMIINKITDEMKISEYEDVQIQTKIELTKSFFINLKDMSNPIIDISSKENHHPQISEIPHEIKNTFNSHENNISDNNKYDKLVNGENCNYKFIQESIYHAKSGDKIKISCDPSKIIAWEGNIFISKNLIIEGDKVGEKLVTFDGQGKYRFFVVGSINTSWGVVAENISFTLKNILMKNGYGEDLAVGRRGGCTSSGCWGEPELNNDELKNPVMKKDGGCIYVGASGKLQIVNVIFDNCTSDGDTPLGGTEPNEITYNGGAIFSSTNATLEVTESVFHSCKSMQNGGAIYGFWQSSIISVSNSTFYMNFALDKGGAINVHETVLFVKNSIFFKNKSTFGSAIYCLLSDMDIIGTIFNSNTNENAIDPTEPASGAIYINGARAKTSEKSGKIFLSNCSIENNISSGKGGGLFICPYGYNSGDQIKIFESYICNNIVQNIAENQNLGSGAAIQYECGADNAKVILDTVIVDNNTVSNYKGEVYKDENMIITIPNKENGVIVVGNSRVPGYLDKATTGCPNNSEKINSALLKINLN